MRNFRIYIFIAIAAITSVFIYSCAKETDKQTSKSQTVNLSIEKAWQDIKSSDPNMVVTPILESRTAGLPTSSPCFVQPSQDQTCSANHIVTTLNLPAVGTRPACSDMKVEYDLVICIKVDPLTGQLIWTFDFSAFEAFPGNCTAFMTWYNSLTPQQKSDEQDKWEYQLTINEELNVVKGIVTANSIPPNCGTPNTPMFTSNWFTDICYNRCLTPTKVFPYWKTVKSFCGTQCCKRTRTACVGLSGNVLFGPPTFETKGTACTISPTVCPFNSIPLSQFCGVTCGPK